MTLPAVRPLVVGALDLAVGVLLYLYVAAPIGVLLATVGVLVLGSLAYEATVPASADEGAPGPDS